MATLEPPKHLDDTLLAAMNVTREFLARRTRDKARLDAAAPGPGGHAPDFTAPLVGSDGTLTGDSLTLHSLLGKPLGLLFGSYTCPIFRNQLGRYEAIHQALDGRANFLCVYILEAHPEDGWRVPHNWEAGICFPTPRSLAERAKIAHLCRTEQGLTIPMVLDGMDDALARRYAGSPERLYAIAADGTIIHRSAIGPFDGDDVETWYAALAAAGG